MNVKALAKINKNFAIVLFLVFLNSGGLMLPILATLFFNDLKFNIEIIGLIMSFFGIGGLVGGYLGGYLADYIRSKNIVSISLIGNGIFTIFFTFLQDVLLFSICMFCVGLFNTSFRPSSLLLLFETKDELSQVKALSYRRVANSLGFAISSISFGFLYHIVGRWAFFMIGMLFVFTFVLSFLIKNINMESKERREKEIEKNPNLKLFIGLNLVCILFTIVFNQYQTTYNLFLTTFAGLSPLDISMIFTIRGIFVVLFQIPISNYLDKIKLSLGCFIGSCMLALGMGLTSLVSNFALAVFFCILWTLAEMILPPLSIPFILKTSIYKRGKTMGIQQIAFSSGLFLAPIVGSFFYKISPTLLWNMCFIASTISALFFLYLYKFYEKD